MTTTKKPPAKKTTRPGRTTKLGKGWAVFNGTVKEVEYRGPVVTDEDREELRADVAFHDGTVSLLTYPSKILAFWGEEPPRSFAIPEGGYLLKGIAGDFRVVFKEQFEHELSIVDGGGR